MKKLLARALGFICSIAMVAGIAMPVSAKADYTYTVKFRVGAQGTFNTSSVAVLGKNGQPISANVSLSADNKVVTISGLEYGSRVSFDKSSVTLNNGSKYYVKGIREGGKDNDTISATSFVVKEDMDYVVGYALLADVVAYTVEYVDNHGNVLYPTETFYGNVGDKPVIAFRFFDDFVPNAYNLTGVLYANATENVFRFVYTPMSELPANYLGYIDNGSSFNGNVTITPGGGVTVIPGNGGNGGAAGAGGNGAAGAGDGGANANPVADGDGNVNIDEETTPANNGPAEIIDIRDEESALANGIAGDNGSGAINLESPSAFFSSIPLGVKIGVTAGLVVILGVTTYFLFIRKKEEK